MKKQIYLILVLVLSATASYGQEKKKPFDDARKIKQNINNSQVFKKILERYIPELTLEKLKQNPFLKECDMLIKNFDSKDSSATVGETQSASPGFSFIPQKDAIDALGTFIAERFKQEINVAFLDRFRESLKKDTNLSKLMPGTTLFLSTNDPYNYASFMESFRSTLKKDFNKLPEHIPSFVEYNKKTLVNGTNLTEDGYCYLMMGLNAISSYSQKKSSAKIIADITDQALQASTYKDASANFKTRMQIMNMLVTELTDDVSNDWYKTDDITNLLKEQSQESAFIFMGLLYEKYRTQITVLNSVELPDFVNKFHKSIILIDEYTSKIKTLREANIDVKNSELIEYANLTINLVEKCLKISTTVLPVDAKAENFLTYAKQSLTIIGSLYDGAYADALVGTLEFSTKLLPNSSFKTNYVKYGNFAVNIITAKDSEAMGKALETAALPVGSYKVKRNSVYNISINAFAGGFLGMEYLKKRGDGTFPAGVEKESGLAGFFAPLGVAFSAGEKHEDKSSGGSWSVFITALDLGAVTAFRLTNDKTKTLPELTFKNILAPGAYIIRGFSGSPVSMGIGGQYGPQLRKIEDFDPEKKLLSAWNIRFFIAIDIPLFNFYTKSEK